jgi:hypothetical protein
MLEIKSNQIRVRILSTVFRSSFEIGVLFSEVLVEMPLENSVMGRLELNDHEKKQLREQLLFEVSDKFNRNKEYREKLIQAAEKAAGTRNNAYHLTYDEIIEAEVDNLFPDAEEKEIKRKEQKQNAYFTSRLSRRGRGGARHKRTLRKYKRRTHKRNHRRTHRR